MHKSITVTSWNVHYDERGVKPKYGAFSWTNRVNDIIDEITRIDSDILLLQEIPNYDNQTLRRGLPAYQWQFLPTNARSGKWNLAIAIKPHIADSLKNSEGVIPELDFSEYDFKKIGRHCEKVLFCKLGELLIACVHMPKGQLGRKFMSEHFHKVLANFKYKRLIIGGDFNSLPYDSGYEQMTTMNAVCGTYSATEYAVNESDGKIAKKSYVPYPYNVVSPKYLQLNGKLDHILARNLIVEKSIVHDYTLIPRSSAYLSEHFAITVTFKP